MSSLHERAHCDGAERGGMGKRRNSGRTGPSRCPKKETDRWSICCQLVSPCSSVYSHEVGTVILCGSKNGSEASGLPFGQISARRWVRGKTEASVISVDASVLREVVNLRNACFIEFHLCLPSATVL